MDNSTVFQVGANEGEDVAIDIGNMSADALGVTRAEHAALVLLHQAIEDRKSVV